VSQVWFGRFGFDRFGFLVLPWASYGLPSSVVTLSGPEG
jgi:hypothetical protein